MPGAWGRKNNDLIVAVAAAVAAAVKKGQIADRAADRRGENPAWLGALPPPPAANGSAAKRKKREKHRGGSFFGEKSGCLQKGAVLLGAAWPPPGAFADYKSCTIRSLPHLGISPPFLLLRIF